MIETLITTETRMPSAAPDSSTHVVIVAGEQNDGVTYQLHPVTRERLRQAFPDAHMPRSLFVGADTRRDQTELRGGMWQQIATLLTGVSVGCLSELGEVVVYFPNTGSQHVVTLSDAA